MEFAIIIIKLLNNLSLDNFDIDWEYLFNNTDISNFVQFLVIICFSLDIYIKEYILGYYFLFSIISLARPIYYKIIYLNFIDIYFNI